MKKFLKNNFADISVKDNAHIIDVFSDASGHKNIVVHDKVHLTYLVVARSSTLHLDIDIQGKHANCQIFAIFVAEDNIVNAKVITHIANSSVKVEKHVISLIGEAGDISVDANIDIRPGIQHVAAHLLEDSIVFGQHVRVKSLPALSVSSHDVKASHGAKIEKINQEKLFYMLAKGLSHADAQKLVVDGYVNAILSHFDEFDERELLFLKDFVQL